MRKTLRILAGVVAFLLLAAIGAFFYLRRSLPQVEGEIVLAGIDAPVEILRQATSTNAEMMMLEGEIGCVAVGAHADLLVVDGDPLKDIGLLAADGKNLRVIVRGGEAVKNELD